MIILKLSNLLVPTYICNYISIFQATISVPHRSSLLTVEQALEQITSAPPADPVTSTSFTVSTSESTAAAASIASTADSAERPLPQKIVLVSTQRVLNLSTSQRLMEIMSPLYKKMKTDQAKSATEVPTENIIAPTTHASGYNIVSTDSFSVHILTVF